LLGTGAPSLGVGVRETLGNTTIDLTLRAMEEQGLIRTLARPNLVALSGEEAEFLAGGEFPYPVPMELDKVAIEFKPFGVALKFTPEILPSGAIRMKVSPEVSQLDVRQQIRINGIDLPSLTVRRATTTIELTEGTSFAIAGLFQEDYVNSVREAPGLGNLPVLGALFKSQRWRRQETELLIVVTPRLADPARSAAQMAVVAPDPGGMDLLFERIAGQAPLPPIDLSLEQAPGT
jgi:pilus assembly protein CpaC